MNWFQWVLFVYFTLAFIVRLVGMVHPGLRKDDAAFAAGASLVTCLLLVGTVFAL